MRMRVGHIRNRKFLTVGPNNTGLYISQTSAQDPISLVEL